MSRWNHRNVTPVILVITGFVVLFWSDHNRAATDEIEQKRNILVRQLQAVDNIVEFSENNVVEKQKPLVERCTAGPEDLIPDALVKTYKNKVWKAECGVCQGLENKIGKKYFRKVMFNSTAVGQMPIYIHNPKVEGVSRSIFNTHNFDLHIFQTLFSLLQLDKETSLLDVGAHIGVNALQAAHYGRDVIAMEATTESTQHLCASAREGKVENKLTIIHNAVSNVHTTVKFIHSWKGQFDGGFMDDGSDLRKLKVKWDGNIFNFKKFESLETVTLDDLLKLPNICAFKKVIIKIDVEGSEHKAFLGAKKFFENVDVQGVLMEYRWHVTRPSKDVIVEFFEEFKFDPFDFRSGYMRKVEPTSLTEYHDVLWIPRYRSKDLEGMKLW